MSTVKRTHSEKKRHAIIEAALSVFTEQGFEGAKMDSIAEHAGVSKQTIYSHFGSKENLFHAILEDICNGYASLFETNINTHINDPKEALRLTMLQTIPEMYASKDSKILDIQRLIFSETARYPELGLTHLKRTQEYLKELAKVMSLMAEKGIIECQCPERAAADFTALTKGHIAMNSLCSATPVYTKEEVEDHINKGIDVFFRAYGKK